MTQQEVFNKIGGIIKELTDQYKYLEENTGKLHDIEFEFFVANAQFLTHNAEMLRKLNSQVKPVKPEEPAPPKAIKPEEPVAPPVVMAEERPVVKAEEKYFEPLVRQPEPVIIKQEEAPMVKEEALKFDYTNEGPANIDIASDTPTDDYSYIRQEPEVIRHELVVDEAWDEEDEPAGEEPVLEPKASVSATNTLKDELAAEPIKVETPVIEEPAPIKAETQPAEPAAKQPEPVVKQPEPVKTANEEPLTINQRMSAQLAPKQTALVAGPAISDLKSAINLNDKMLYVKDLFNGYSLAYNEAIEILNRYSSFAEADEFLKTSYYTKNHWQDKPGAVEKFYDLLKRRYS